MLARGRSARRLLLAVSLALLGALLCGLASALASSPSPGPSPGKIVLRVGWIMDPDSLNPFVATNFTAAMITQLNYDYLVGFDPSTLTPSKGAHGTGLATDWRVSPDGKHWTFALRRNAVWQDGYGPVTAADVAFTLNYVIDNQMANYVTYVEGMRRATAVDTATVSIDCVRPKADMLSALGVIPILPKHIWAHVSPKTAGNAYTNSPPIIGSGPFECVAFKKGAYVTMVANKRYWHGAPKIDEVIFEYFTSADSMGMELTSGTIDACYQPEDTQMRRLQHEPGYVAKKVLVNGYDDLAFNCYVPPPGGKSLGNPVLRDPRFRQALQWAVDKNQLVQVAYAGNAKVGDTVVTAGYYTNPDWHWTPPANQAYSFDLSKAGQLLDAAGYRDSNGDGWRDYRGKPIKLRLWAFSEYGTSVRDVKLIAVWLRQLGLQVVISDMDFGSIMARVFNTANGKPAPDFDLVQNGWYLGIDPGQSMSFFTTGQIGTWNDSGFSNPEFDRLYVEQSRVLDPNTRKQLIDRMQQIVFEQSPYVVLAYYGDTEAWNSKWVGWVPSPAKGGSAVMDAYSYLFVHPETSGGTAATATSGPVALLVLAGVVVAVVAGLLLWRRRRPPAEE